MFLVCLLFVSNSAWSQQTTAAITGTVMDEGGAAINGATITATDTDRGTTYTATTNDSGTFNLTRVPIGNYQVKTEAPGFQSAVQTGLTLVLNQTARLDFKLHVGTVTTTAQVTSEAPQLQSETTQVSTLIDSKTVTDIPLATRNYVELTLLAPGSVHPDASMFNNGDNTAGGARPYINGNREQSNNFLLDGIDNNQASDNLLGFTPSPDAIGEFNMITQNASAEFGNYNGGIVNAVIKSGTNRYHGDVFEFFRNEALNARNLFAQLIQIHLQPRKQKQRRNPQRRHHSTHRGCHDADPDPFPRGSARAIRETAACTSSRRHVHRPSKNPGILAGSRSG